MIPKGLQGDFQDPVIGPGPGYYLQVAHLGSHRHVPSLERQSNFQTAGREGLQPHMFRTYRVLAPSLRMKCQFHQAALHEELQILRDKPRAITHFATVPRGNQRVCIIPDESNHRWRAF